MNNVDIISKVVARKGEAMASPSKDSAAPVNLSGYLLKEVWDKCWEIRTTDQGEEYLFGKYPVAVQYGLTSYVDGKRLKLPSIYDGLPIDYQTLYWEETTNEDGSVTRVLKARGIGNSDGGGGNIPDLSAYVTEDEANALIKAAKGVILETWTSGGGNAITSISLGTDKKSLVIEKNETFALQTDYGSLSQTVGTLQSSFSDMVAALGKKLDKSTFESWVSQNGPKIANGFTAYGWGNHAEAGYVTSLSLNETLKRYVTLGDEQTIEGKKNFTGGLLVNGQELFFDKDGRYWKMEGNLLVTGGITNYSSDGKATPFLVNADKWEDVTSESTTQVYSAKAVTLLKNEVQSVGENADLALEKLEIIKEELSTLTDSSLTTAIRTVLLNIKERI